MREKPESERKFPSRNGHGRIHTRYVWLRLGDSAVLEKELEGLVHGHDD
jgi:hypothetical protein